MPARAPADDRAMHPDTFMFLALQLFAVLAVGLVVWTLVHFAAPREPDDVPPSR